MKVSVERPRVRPPHPLSDGGTRPTCGTRKALTSADAVVPQEIKFVDTNPCTRVALPIAKATPAEP